MKRKVDDSIEEEGGRKITFQDFTGSKVYLRGDDEKYKKASYQYGYSSHGQDGSMEPAAIIYPHAAHADDEVKKVIQYAVQEGVAIAVRTGGHQYSGASSTSGDNIQLDLSEAYIAFEHDEAKDELRVGVSFTLSTLNEKLKEMGCFVPHGQCSHVHVGGHAQTGGYGQLGRAFGLFADHIVQIEVWTVAEAMKENGVKRIVRRDSTKADDKDLFYAVLGGSPGNFGVLTHITLKPHHDKDHPFSRGLKMMVKYEKPVLQRLLTIMEKWASDVHMPGDYDFCITVMSETDSLFRKYLKGRTLDDVRQRWENDKIKMGRPRIILVYLQYANRSGQNDFQSNYFEEISNVIDTADVVYLRWPSFQPVSMSELTGQWVFRNEREFRKPYVKRTWLTDSTTLEADDWSRKTTERVDFFLNNKKNAKLTAQIQHLGGDNSAFRTKADEKTSYSWRKKTTVVQVLDAFYDPREEGSKEFVEEWQKENDELFVGANGILFKTVTENTDHRVLWGSWGNSDMSKVWRCYHDEEEKYKKLCEIKKRVDPLGTFTPNSFCVGGLDGRESGDLNLETTESATTKASQVESSDWQLGEGELSYMESKAKWLLDNCGTSCQNAEPFHP